MRRVLAVLALASIPVLSSSTAAALGFGRTGNASLLGQPLDFSAVLLLDPGETLRADCASAEVLAGDTRFAPSRVHVLVDPPRGPRVTVHVRTTVRIVEPVATVRLSVGCTTRVSRSFVALIEPSRGGSDAAAAGLARDAQVQARAGGAEPTPERGVADAGLLQRERDRVTALEQDLSRERAENSNARQSLAQLQDRWREAEAARHNPPLVYGLGTLVLLLLMAIGWLLWRVSGLRPGTSQARVEASGQPAELAHSLHESPLDHTWAQARVMTDAAPSRPFPLQPTELPMTTAPATRPAARELSVDDVLDLEQQADFLVALGQDEAAIDLLMGHLRSSGGASALPYLKLLDIYRRRADGDAHERIRQRFNRRFNAHAPSMAADPDAGQSLSGYSEVMARLQEAWKSPDAAPTWLESLMVRSDTGDPGFDPPAFVELMLLHAVARDLRERAVDEGGVDLLLPLAEETRVISIGAAPADTLDLRLP